MRSLLVLLALALPAHAGGRAEHPDAARHNERGKALVSEGKYAAAVEEFRAALRIGAQPKYLFNLAQALRLADRCSEAIESYQQFLAAVPDDPDAELTRKNIQTCRATLATQAPTPPPPPRKPWHTDRLADGLAIGGAGALLGAGALFLLGNANARDTATAGQFSAFDDAASAATRERILGAICAGVGVALTTAALVRWLTHERGAVEVAAAPVAQGGELVVSVALP